MGSAMTRMVFHGQDWVSELTSFIGHTVPFHLLPLSLPTTNYAETERLVGRPTHQAEKRKGTDGEGRTAEETNDRLQMELPLFSSSSPFLSSLCLLIPIAKERERDLECEQSRQTRRSDPDRQTAADPTPTPTY